MKFFLVRHGETEWNRLGRFQGQVDIALNDRGLAQARDTARAAVSWRPSALYASPLVRTMQVAEEVSGRVGLPIIPEPRLMELNLGQLDGVTGQEMQEQWSQVYRGWRHDPETTVMPGGESLAQLQARAWQVLLDLEQSHDEQEVVVLVSHNFAIRTIVTKLLGMPWSHFHQTYLSLGSICTLESNSRGRRLLCYNSTSHLFPENRS